MQIKHAILHILENGREPVFSNEELDIDSEICHEFISRHVRRLISSPAAKKATFSAESEVYGFVGSYKRGECFFGEFSRLLCAKLALIMENSEIPSGDILVVAFEQSGLDYLAMLKLNYLECFTHSISDGENHLVKNANVLPFTHGKVEEACLIPFDPMILQILEKPCVVGDEEQMYFSTLFLECETELSKKETAEILNQVLEEVTAKHFEDDVEAVAKIKYALIEEAESSAEDAFMLVGAAGRAFADKPSVKDEFLSLAYEAGLPHEVKLPAAYARKQFNVQRFKAGNGVEVKIPAELFEDPDAVQFTTNADGTVSITLKNLQLS